MDEPAGGGSDDPNDYSYYDHIYTNNLEETREILQEFYALIKSYGAVTEYDRVDMLEIYLTAEQAEEFYVVGDFPFNFGFIDLALPVLATRMKTIIDDWVEHTSERKTSNWVVSGIYMYTVLIFRLKQM